MDSGEKSGPEGTRRGYGEKITFPARKHPSVHPQFRFRAKLMIDQAGRLSKKTTMRFTAAFSGRSYLQPFHITTTPFCAL